MNPISGTSFPCIPPSDIPHLHHDEPSSLAVTPIQSYEFLKGRFLEDFQLYLDTGPNNRLMFLDGNSAKLKVPHYLMWGLRDLLLLLGGDYSTALETCLSEEDYNDKLLDLLNCPLTHLIFNEPVLLSSGHTVEREAIFQWVETRSDKATNPFTGEPLGAQEELFHDDPLTGMLLKLLTAYQISRDVNAADREVALEKLHGTVLLVDESVRWCRLLSVVMPPRQYFARAKGDNHFVLEARLPLQHHSGGNLPEDCPYSVLRTSFFVNRKGDYVRFCEMDTAYSSLDMMLRTLGCEDFTPLQVEKQRQIAQMLGKEAFLQHTSIVAEDAERRDRLLSVVDLLERRYSEKEVADLCVANPNHSLLRASVSPCSRPSFTLQHNGRKQRVTLAGGDLVAMSAVRFWKTGPEYLMKVRPGAGSESWIPLSGLDAEHPDEGAILAEWKAVQAWVEEAREGWLFVLSEAPGPLVPSGRFYTPPQEHSYAQGGRKSCTYNC